MLVFAYLVTGSFEVNLDNDSYFAGESKYHAGIVVSGNYTGGDDIRGGACTGIAPGKSFKMADDTLVHKAEIKKIKGGDEKGQDPWDSCINRVMGEQRKYICENEDCVQLNVTFFSEKELDEHVKRTHHCVKPGCPFSHMNAEILYNHTSSHWLNYVDYMCEVCNKVFDDQAQ